MRSLVPAFFLLAVVATPALAKYGEANCFNEVVTKNAMLRKYDYKYMWGSSESLTKGQEGSSHVTSQNSTQGTTAGVDPGYTTGDTQAQFMSTSSKKPCESFWADNGRYEREKFIAANSDELKRDIARGAGQNLQAVAVLSGCNTAVLPHFYETVRTSYDALAPLSPDGGALSSALDDVIAKDFVLSQGCAG